MKKIYNAPTTTCVELRATNMIALSLNDETITSDNFDDYEQNVKVNSSNYNLWDDDWDD